MIRYLLWMALELLGRNRDRRLALALDSISEEEQ